jgi:anaerobic selenocysteine-containing dehydrogenase
VNISQLGRALTELRDPAIHALFVYNANPWSTAPHQHAVERGLLREDLFTVVAEQVMTDTARFADVVLPVTTFLEHEELARSYGAMTLLSSEPALTPRGQARSNFALFTEITERLGLLREGEPRTASEARARILQTMESQPAGALS